MGKNELDLALEELSRWPWWANLIGAVLVYPLSLWLLGVWEHSENPALKGIGLGFRGFAWLPSGVFAIGALGSLLRRRRRENLVSGTLSLEALRHLRWEDFEVLVGEVGRRFGYAVEERGSANADGGIDLVFRKDGDVILVQCKHWRKRKVGVGIVRELNGVVEAKQANRGVVVITGTFTKEAYRFAALPTVDVKLMNGEEFLQWLRKAQIKPSWWRRKVARSDP